MANINNLKPFLNHSWSSGGYIGDDYKSFSTKLRNYMKKIADENGLQMVSYNRMHYESSGFFRNKTTGIYVYWNISDVRFFHNEWYNKVLYRVAENEKDFHGKENNYCSITSLAENILKITNLQ